MSIPMMHKEYHAHLFKVICVYEKRETDGNESKRE